MRVVTGLLITVLLVTCGSTGGQAVAGGGQIENRWGTGGIIATDAEDDRTFSGRAEALTAIRLTSDEFDPHLQLYEPDDAGYGNSGIVVGCHRRASTPSCCVGSPTPLAGGSD